MKLPLPRMTYDEAMERFGHDAPDLRFGMELVDLTDLAKEAEFRVFRGAADGGGRVRGINAKGAAASYSRKNIDDLTDFVVQDFGAKGLAWFKVEEDGTLASPIAKNFTPELLAKIAERMQAEPGDLLLFVADQVRSHLQGALRAAQAVRRGAEAVRSDDDELFLDRRVSDVRLGRGSEKLGRHAPSVHRAAAAGPRAADNRSGQVPRQAYDLVINGSEAGGGTIRIHDPEVQQQVFALLGIDRRASPRAVRVFARRAGVSALRRTAALRWASTAG